MPSHILDFNNGAAWTSKESLIDHYAEKSSTPSKYGIHKRPGALRTAKAKEHPRRTSGLVAFVVLVPIFLGVLGQALEKRSKESKLDGDLNSFNATSRMNATATSPTLASPINTFPLSSSHGTTHKFSFGGSPTSSAAGTGATLSPSTSRTSCFPLGSAKLPSSGTPSISRDDWWCDSDLMYGFMGWSYPLESSDCSDLSNGYAKINQDLAAMKARGASMVRIYAPECRQLSVWENLVKACIQNNLGLIPMVWWGFSGNQNLWKTGQSNIYSLFTTSQYASIAPYVVHSASFGSEPIGDQVDGGATQFVSDLQNFKAKMNGWGISVGISEDWDRTQDGMAMNTSSGALGPVGLLVQANTDIVHAHVMPYYHPDETPYVTDALPYTKSYLAWLQANVQQPILITETMWASTMGFHARGYMDEQIGMGSFQQYWKGFAASCSMWKQYKAGWVFHTFQDTFEPGFGLLTIDNQPKISPFKPTTC
ncbi:hypothetical protein T439DRAFT_355307 [Meredithblackwellia eburnea MCA 4105]